MKVLELLDRFPKTKDVLRYIYRVLILECLRESIHYIHILFPNEYDNLKRFKDIHKGEMCFIVCTGPSLRIEDLDKLKEHDVCSLSMNSIIKAFDQTEWRPNYYGIQDLGVYRALLPSYKDSDFVNTEVFYDDLIQHFGFKKNMNPVTRGNKYFKHWHWRWKENRKRRFNFSTHIEHQIYGGSTITYDMLQIAVYMGFTEIYFLGLDCNSPLTGKTHFIEYWPHKKQIDAVRGYDHRLPMEAFEYAYNFLRERNSGVHIYNATRGGCLEVFPRVNFDELWD